MQRNIKRKMEKGEDLFIFCVSRHIAIVVFLKWELMLGKKINQHKKSAMNRLKKHQRDQKLVLKSIKNEYY